jgi:hypothetical protein
MSKKSIIWSSPRFRTLFCVEIRRERGVKASKEDFCFDNKNSQRLQKPQNNRKYLFTFL